MCYRACADEMDVTMRLVCMWVIHSTTDSIIARRLSRPAMNVFIKAKL
jgi:hypothetical protein